MRRIAVFLALLCGAAHAQEVQSIWFDPLVVRTNRADPVAIRVQATSDTAALRLDLAAGGSVSLSKGTSGEWTATLSATQVLSGYTSADVNHNFVGFLRVLKSDGTVVATYNEFIGVIDSRVPTVRLHSLDGSTRSATRVMTAYRPAIAYEDDPPAAVEFYRYFPDNFDFLQIVYAAPSVHANRHFVSVKQDVSGIGLSLRDSTAAYGSHGRLRGVIVYPLWTLFDDGESAASHEIGHCWINFLTNNEVRAASPHWPQSTMALGIMGMSIPGSGAGGNYPWNLVRASDGSYTFHSAAPTQAFSDLDLYLMGFLPPEQVGTNVVLANQTQTPCDGCPISGAVLSLTVNDVISANGVRVPAAAASPKHFRVATVVVTHERMLNDDELIWFDYFAARGEAMEPLPYTSGFAAGTTLPFYLATRQIGSLDFRLNILARRRAVTSDD
jgi:hypothetical protein